MTEKTFTISLSENQLNLVAQALGELPFKISQPLIAELQRQLQTQIPDPKAD